MELGASGEWGWFHGRTELGDMAVGILWLGDRRLDCFHAIRSGGILKAGSLCL